MSYRTAPVPLPSIRDVDAEYVVAQRELRDLLDAQKYSQHVREPDVLWELREERRARDRAAAAPCPAFVVDPSAVCPPMHKVFAYVPPPAKKGPALLPLNVPE